MSRWSIEELRARYELEPGLYDVFVEGVFDREVLSQAPICAQKNIALYEIDAVEVPGELLTKYGLTSGNKQRVIALSKEMASLPVSAKVLCFVDRDLDHWLGDLPVLPRLRWSAYCSIEAHFATEQYVSDILVKAGRIKIKNLDTFLKSLWLVLRQLYALRLADGQLGLSLNWPSVRRYLYRKADAINFDVQSYANSLLNSNGHAKAGPRFEECRSQWLNKLTCDIRLSARGHDYTELLAWAMSERRPPDFE